MSDWARLAGLRQAEASAGRNLGGQEGARAWSKLFYMDVRKALCPGCVRSCQESFLRYTSILYEEIPKLYTKTNKNMQIHKNTCKNVEKYMKKCYVGVGNRTLA